MTCENLKFPSQINCLRERRKKKKKTKYGTSQIEMVRHSIPAIWILSRNLQPLADLFDKLIAFWQRWGGIHEDNFT